MRRPRKIAPAVVTVDLAPQDRADLVAGLALAVEVGDARLNAFQLAYARRWVAELADPAASVSVQAISIIRHVVAVARGGAA